MSLKGYKTCHIIVSGIVQGVGYRYYALRKANALGVTGFVRNLPNGKVEVEAEGKEDLVDEFIRLLRRGPVSASVYEVEVDCYDYTGRYLDFRIKY